ncbi:cytochrome P450 21 [Thozetella sp. PMI_491]|nr:cytochrome P450 21 [Thozetella sp. PMI_491]
MVDMYVPQNFLYIFYASIGYLLFALARFIISTLRPRRFPPGPPTLPGLGNLHQIPLNKPYLTFASWAKQYGPIIGLKFGPANFVILHRAEEVRELFECRGALFAARPKMVIPCDYVFPGEWEQHAVFMSVDFQRKQRKATRHHLSPAGLEELAPIQRAMAVRLAHDLLDGSNFIDCFHHWSLAAPLSMIGGQKVEDLGPEWVHKYHETQKTWVSLLEPGIQPPVDLFPVLAWLPERFASWKKKAASVRHDLHEVYASMMTHAKRLHDAHSVTKRDPGTARYESLMARMLREEDEKTKSQRFSEREVALIGGSLLDAAADTTLGAALFLVQALAAFPHIQRRAQEEIDSQLGTELIPEDIDISKLPYLTACIMEVLRWRPTAPQGLPRVCMEDQEILGYRIPKGTTIMCNLWAILHDPDEYDRPEAFEPERYLRNPLGTKHRDNGGNLSWRKPTYAFGAGRRICPGEQFADMALHIAFAHLLWVYDIVPDGHLDLSTETGVISALSLTPKPFPVKFVPRSEQKRQAVVDGYLKGNQLLADILP